MHAIVRWLKTLTCRAPRSLLPATIVLVLVIGGCDYMTGSNLSLAGLYLIPVSAAAWWMNRSSATTICLLAGLVGLLADMALPSADWHPAVPYWNFAIRLGVYGFVAVLLFALRESKAQLEAAFAAQADQLHREIQNRTRSIGGSVVVESRSGQGATLACRFPAPTEPTANPTCELAQT
jgi:hypothetical protein